MTACPYCHDSLDHPGLRECPEVGRPLPRDQTAGPEANPPTQDPATDEPSCPYCSAEAGHPGLDDCPETGGRLPQQRLTRVDDTSEAAKSNEADHGSADRPNAAASATNPFALWQLEIIGRVPIGLDDGQMIVLGRDETTPIGSWCADNISRHHAEFRVEGGSLSVVDLHSTNGTFLNGEQLTSGHPSPCEHGDVVQLATEDPVRIEVREWS